MNQNEELAGQGAASYQPPVEQLLRFGEPGAKAELIEYEKLEFGREHIPELIRMATDETLNAGDPDSDDVWAPLHAWRLLGKLRAEEAVAPLLGLFRRVDEDDDDWVAEDLPLALAEIGPAILPAVTAYLADPTHGEWARTAAMRTIQVLGETWPEMRSECVTVLANQLEKFAEQSESINGSLVSDLLDLLAVEATPVMEKAFAAGRVDEMCAGDWEDIQIELGLRQERVTERKQNPWTDIKGKLRSLLGRKEDGKFPFFVSLPGAGRGMLHFPEGEGDWAGTVWNLDLDCCSDPLCSCWTVNFECEPEGDDGGEPLFFSICANERHLVDIPSDEPADIKANEFGRAVVKALQEDDWDRLAFFCEEEKHAMLEYLDVSELEGEFPAALTGGEMAGYQDVFPFARPFLFEYDGETWAATDLYCIQRDCKCHDAFLDFQKLDDTEAGKEAPVEDGCAVRFDYRSGQDQILHPGKPGSPSAKALMAAMKSDNRGFREKMKTRHEQLRFLNASAMRKQGVQQQVVRSTAKIGRNDPCSCESGKKFKKCCGK